MTIAEVGEKFGLTADSLRYYERIGLIPPVSRTRGNIRNYSEADCRWVEFIKCMRNAGLAVEVLIEYVGLFQKGDSTRNTRKAILIEQRKKLAEHIEELRGTLDRLDGKIARYDTALLKLEKKLIA